MLILINLKSECCIPDMYKQGLKMAVNWNFKQIKNRYHAEAITSRCVIYVVIILNLNNVKHRSD